MPRACQSQCSIRRIPARMASVYIISAPGPKAPEACQTVGRCSSHSPLSALTLSALTLSPQRSPFLEIPSETPPMYLANYMGLMQVVFLQRFSSGCVSAGYLLRKLVGLPPPRGFCRGPPFSDLFFASILDVIFWTFHVCCLPCWFSV